MGRVGAHALVVHFAGAIAMRACDAGGNFREGAGHTRHARLWRAQMSKEHQLIRCELRVALRGRPKGLLRIRRRRVVGSRWRRLRGWAARR